MYHEIDIDIDIDIEIEAPYGCLLTRIESTRCAKASGTAAGFVPASAGVAASDADSGRGTVPR
jgi:hypothetical protein